MDIISVRKYFNSKVNDIIDENSASVVHRVVGAIFYRNYDGKVDMWLEEVLVDPLVAG